MHKQNVYTFVVKNIFITSKYIQYKLTPRIYRLNMEKQLCIWLY